MDDFQTLVNESVILIGETNMKSIDKPIIVLQNFRKPVEKVWEVVTHVNHMKRWFFNALDEFKPEVGFETQFDVHTNGKTFTHQWKMTEVIPLRKITYNWKYGGYPGDSFVTFKLLDEPNGSQLTLTHEIVQSFPGDIPEFSRESCTDGWNYFIKKSLKDYIEEI